MPASTLDVSHKEYFRTEMLNLYNCSFSSIASKLSLDELITEKNH